MVERFTVTVRRAISLARGEAVASGSSTIDVRHLTMGILASDLPFWRERLERDNLELDDIRDQLAHISPEVSRHDRNELPFSDDCKRVFVKAQDRADQLQKRDIDTPELFDAVVESNSVIRHVLIGPRSG